MNNNDGCAQLFQQFIFGSTLCHVVLPRFFLFLFIIRRVSVACLLVPRSGYLAFCIRRLVLYVHCVGSVDEK